MSEFGRTVKESGDSGADHGHANHKLLLGAVFLGYDFEGKKRIGLIA